MGEQGCTTESLTVTTTCKDHQQECIPVYCRDCKTPVCSVCVITGQHSKHNLTGIVDAANDTQIDLEELLHDRDSVLQHANSLSSRVDEVRDICSLHKEGVLQTISERADKITQETLKITSELIEKVECLSESYGREFNDTQNDTKTVIRVLQCLDNSDDLCRLNDVEKAYFKLTLQTILKTKVEDLPHQSGFPFSFKTSEFRPQMLRSNVFGEIIDENETASDFHDTNTAGAMKGLKLELDTPREKGSFDCEGDYSTQETRVYKYGNKAIKNIVPVDAWNAYVIVHTDLCKMNFTGSEITSTSIMKNVEVISTTPTDTVLVIQTNSRRVSHILQDGRIVRFCESEKLQPATVCASHKAFAIILMYQNQGSIDKHPYHSLNVAEYDHEGVVVRYISNGSQHYGHCSFEDRSLCHSCSDEVIYAFGERSVYNLQSGVNIYDAKFKLKTSYKGSIGPDPEKSFRPTGICIDDNNQILVAVPRDNAIHMLDKAGKYIRLLLSEKDNTCMKSPWSVFLDKRGNLWVGTENGDIIIQNYKRLISSV